MKKLEELGIGRPSTYATIIAVLQERKYVKVEKLRFIPEDRGRIVTVFLENYFKKYVEYDFTAQMEEFLDNVSAGEMQWKKLLEGFWIKFANNVEAVKPLQVSEVIEKIDEVLAHHLFPTKEDGTDPRVCPECGSGRLSIKLGKFGAFVGCSNYPDCKYTKPLVDTSDEENSDNLKTKEVADRVLGEMGGLSIYLKKGPYGFYVQLGEDQTATTEKPKRSALPREISTDDITLEQAIRLLSMPLDLGEGIEVNSGKFGPYVKLGTKSASLRGNDNIFNITLERAKELLAGAKEKPQGKALGIHPKNKQEIILLMGRYGPYLKCGKNNYALPKDISGHEPSLDEAIKIIDAKK